MQCQWCKYDKSIKDGEVQYILDEQKGECICTECFPEYADHEIAMLHQKLKKAKECADGILETLNLNHNCQDWIARDKMSTACDYANEIKEL